MVNLPWRQRSIERMTTLVMIEHHHGGTGKEDRFCCHHLMFIEAYDVPASIYRYYKYLLQVL